MATKKGAVPDQSLKAFKGFDKDLKCRGMQYAIGATFNHVGDVQACHGGLHSCEYPLDVFTYYPPSESRFAVVKASGSISRESGGDSKIASAQLVIEAEIGIPQLVSAAIEWITSRCTLAEGDKATGTRGAASATGYQGAASATGYQGAASATGDQGAASATGDQGAASATGYQGTASATGTRGAASATGRWGKAKGATGNALFLVYRDGDWNIVHAFAGIVGQGGLKPETFYCLNDKGQPEEVA